jgi:pimeloyl-ACP methyl ester carboxylesterase
MHMSDVAVYAPQCHSRSIFVTVRGLQYHVREWITGATSKTSDLAAVPTMVLLHGWMDVSASFQFMVDALQGSWRVLALDWRGFGLTDTPVYDNYWFPDYLADLELVLDALELQRIVLVGHSMGGNLAMLYAGIRPDRILKLVNLEGTGMAATRPDQALERYRRFIDELKGGAHLKSYASLEEVALRLRGNNARLSLDKARFLASHWARQGDDGAWHLRADPAHKRSTPTLYQVEEALGVWRAMTAPCLMVLAGERDNWHQFVNTPAFRERLLAIPKLQLEEIAEVGHMLHHDQPQVIASLIEAFLNHEHR